MEILHRENPVFITWMGLQCGGVAPPDFGRSVNPISTRGDRLCPPIYYWYPRIFRPSDGPAIVSIPTYHLNPKPPWAFGRCFLGAIILVLLISFKLKITVKNQLNLQKHPPFYQFISKLFGFFVKDLTNHFFILIISFECIQFWLECNVQKMDEYFQRPLGLIFINLSKLASISEHSNSTY